MSSEILSSTGDLGPDFRSNDRLYWNSRFGIIHDGRFVERQARRAQEALDFGITSRVVGRLFMSDQALRESYQSSALVQSGLEAAIMFENSGEPIIMAMFGFNHPNRQSLVPVDRMVRDTGKFETGVSPGDRVQRLRDQGITFFNRIEPQFVSDVLELWGPTFGWDALQVTNLQNRLVRQAGSDPRSHSVWLSAALYDGQVISLATAERLAMPLVPEAGVHVNIIESTEWRTREGWGSMGIMAATAAYLNAQIIHAQRGAEDYRIIAETNYRSHAYLVGAAIGMQVPQREYPGGVFVPQVLQQNVEVCDGLEPVGLRDFIFMELSPFMIAQAYTDPVIKKILGRGA